MNSFAALADLLEQLSALPEKVDDLQKRSMPDDGRLVYSVAEADYDRLLQVLGCHSHDEIELKDMEINQIVHDDFGWKHLFTANSATYGGE